MDKVIIHSSYEFTGGLLYTALSRVKSIDDVQVLGFRREHVSKRDNMLNAISELPQINLKNCPCFRDVSWQAIEDVQPLKHDISDQDLLKIVQGMFDETGAADQFISIHDNEETESELRMEEVLEMVEQNGHILAKPPDDFDAKVLLMSSKGATFTDDKGNFGNLKNKAVDSAIANVDQFSGLVHIVWFKIFSICRNI